MFWSISILAGASLVVASIALLRFNFKIITVSGNSMYPTLSPGERLLAKKVWQHGQLRTGQIVIGKMEALPQPPDLSHGFSSLEEMDLPVIEIYPDEQSLEEFQAETSIQSQREPSNFIKRIEGLAGDHVEVNIKELHEIMQAMLKPTSNFSDTLNWTIPEAHCFLRGDGLVSMDSLVLGPVHLDAIDSVVIAKFPRPAKHPNYTHDKPLDSELQMI